MHPLPTADDCLATSMCPLPGAWDSAGDSAAQEQRLPGAVITRALRWIPGARSLCGLGVLMEPLWSILGRPSSQQQPTAPGMGSLLPTPRGSPEAQGWKRRGAALPGPPEGRGPSPQPGISQARCTEGTAPQHDPGTHPSDLSTASSASDMVSASLRREEQSARAEGWPPGSARNAGPAVHPRR